MSGSEPAVAKAVSGFWKTRSRQDTQQGGGSGRDRGNRSAVTGGAQFDAFTDLVVGVVRRAGLPAAGIHRRKRVDVVLPGYFRPTKEWDLLAVHEGQLVAAIEFKSLCGPSFGNNYNNRVEEAVGTATDLLTAYREGGLGRSHPHPWLGFLYLLEEAPGSTCPVRVSEPHFPIDPKFRGASYLKRCELTCQRLVLERLYSSACLLASPRKEGARGQYQEPAADLGFGQFARALEGQVVGRVGSGRGR